VAGSKIIGRTIPSSSGVVADADVLTSTVPRMPSDFASCATRSQSSSRAAVAVVRSLSAPTTPVSSSRSIAGEPTSHSHGSRCDAQSKSLAVFCASVTSCDWLADSEDIAAGTGCACLGITTGAPPTIFVGAAGCAAAVEGAANVMFCAPRSSPRSSTTKVATGAIAIAANKPRAITYRTGADARARIIFSSNPQAAIIAPIHRKCSIVQPATSQ
jgi:hypothetical protein